MFPSFISPCTLFWGLYCPNTHRTSKGSCLLVSVVGALAQGPILHSHNHLTQDGVGHLGLAPVLSGHTGNPYAVFYGVQHVQVTTVCFNETHKAFEGSYLHGSDCDSGVYPYGVSHEFGPGHPCQNIHIDICLSCTIVQPEAVVGKASHPLMTHGILLCHCYHVHEQVVVSVDIKGKPIESQPQPTCKWGTSICELGNASQFWSSSCQHSRWCHQSHHHGSGRGWPLGWIHRHWCVAWRAWWSCHRPRWVPLYTGTLAHCRIAVTYHPK